MKYEQIERITSVAKPESIAPGGFRTKDAARYLGVSESFLNKSRLRDPRIKTPGPKFTKIGGVIIYRRKILDAYLAGDADAFLGS